MPLSEKQQLEAKYNSLNAELEEAYDKLKDLYLRNSNLRRILRQKKTIRDIETKMGDLLAMM